MLRALLDDPEFPAEYKNGQLQFIASGSYGDVYEAVSSLTQKKVAIKKVKDIFVNGSRAKSLMREISLLGLLYHPTLVFLKHIVTPLNPESFNSLYLIFEYVDTDLFKITRSNNYFDLDQVQFILFQILAGVKYLHSANILHRDLKPQNILINANCTIKICDYGLARMTKIMEEYTDLALNTDLLDETNNTQSRGNKMPSVSMIIDNNKPIPNNNNTNSNNNTNPMEITSDEKTSQPNSTLPQLPLLTVLTDHVISRWYRPPEIIMRDNAYGKAIDIWSVGCIFAELLMMMRESGYEPANRIILFPGKTCFPFTAQSVNDINSKDDQLNKIFDILGTPTKTDIQSIQDAAARAFVSTLQSKNAKDLKSLYKEVSPDAIDLLKKMLTLNPNTRISVDEALQHPFMTRMVKEFPSATDSSFKQNLSLEKKAALIRYYRYEIEAERCHRTIMKTSDLSLDESFCALSRKLILQEVQKYNKAPEIKKDTSIKVKPVAVAKTASAANAHQAFFSHKKQGIAPTARAQSNLNTNVTDNSSQSTQRMTG